MEEYSNMRQWAIFFILLLVSVLLMKFLGVLGIIFGIFLLII